MIEIKHLEIDGNKGEFIIYEDAVRAGEMTYVWEGEDRININHTQVDKAFAGRGLAKKLVLRGAEFAREKNVKIIPTCWYAEKVLAADDSLRELIYKS